MCIQVQYDNCTLSAVSFVWCLFLDDKEECGDESPTNSTSSDTKPKMGEASPGKSPARASESETTDEKSPAEHRQQQQLPQQQPIDVQEEDIKVPLHAQTSDPVSLHFVAFNKFVLLPNNCKHTFNFLYLNLLAWSD